MYCEEKLTPQSPHLPFSSISSTCSFLFSQVFPSLPLQTRKQSLKEKGLCCFPTEDTRVWSSIYTKAGVSLFLFFIMIHSQFVSYCLVRHSIFKQVTRLNIPLKQNLTHSQSLHLSHMNYLLITSSSWCTSSLRSWITSSMAAITPL